MKDSECFCDTISVASWSSRPPSSAALVAIADHGTFEAAARHLHVTASAVSQRIRALESDVGQVVVRRTTPCRPTPAGEELIRLARQTRLLHDEVRDALAHGHLGTVDLPVAVSADSLATWFRAALADVADWPDVALRLHVEDQAFSADLLRSGDVLAAVTSEPTPVQGCSVERARRAALRAGGRPRGRGPLASRPRPSTGRRCRWWSSTRRTPSSTTCSPRGASPCRRSCTGSRRRRTSSRRSASASAGG